MNETLVQPVRPARQALWWMLLIFSVPLVTVWVLYTWGWRPAQTPPHGQLIQPPVHAPALHAPHGGDFAWQAQADADKWSMLIVTRGPCAQDCQAWLDTSRNIQVALYKNMARVQRVWVGEGPDAQVAQVQSRQPDLRAALVSDAAARQSLGWQDGAAPVQIYLVDPQGWVMMRYGPDQAPRGILKDLEKLLRYS